MQILISWPSFCWKLVLLLSFRVSSSPVTNTNNGNGDFNNYLNCFPSVSMSELSNSSLLATPTYFQLYWEKRLERAPKNVLGDSLFREEIRRTTPPPSRKGGGELYKPTTKPPPPHHRRTPAMGQHSHYNSCILILYSYINLCSVMSWSTFEISIFWIKALNEQNSPRRLLYLTRLS